MPLYVKNKVAECNEKLKMSTFKVTTFLFLENENTSNNGFAFISDINEDSASFYLNVQIHIWTKVKIAFESKDAPPFQGKVVWSQRYAFDPKIKGKRFNNWRCGIKFVFASEPERKRYIEFLNQLKCRFKIDAYKLLEGEVVEDKGAMDALDALTGESSKDSSSETSEVNSEAATHKEGDQNKPDDTDTTSNADTLDSSNNQVETEPSTSTPQDNSEENNTNPEENDSEAA